MTSMDNDDRQGRTGDNTTYCGFVVGQHVVCIREIEPGNPSTAAILARGGSANLPKRGTVYTIREVRPRRRGLFLLLAELVNVSIDTCSGPYEPGFSVKRFRPLQKLKVEDFMQTRVPAPEKREGVSA